VVSEGANLFGGDVLKDKFKSEMPIDATIDTANKTISYWASATEGKTFFTNFKPNTQYTLILKGYASANYCNLAITYTDGTASSITRFPASNVTAQIVFVSDPDKSVRSLVGQYYDGKTVLYYDECGIFEGVLTAEYFKPYIKRTLTMPEAVRNLPDYGVGIPNTEAFNRIRWRYDEQADKWVREYERPYCLLKITGEKITASSSFTNTIIAAITDLTSGVRTIDGGYCDKYDKLSTGQIGSKDGVYLSYTSNVYITDGRFTDLNTAKAILNERPVYVVGIIRDYASEYSKITDISDILPEDNLIGVQGRGTMRAENEFGYDVPMTVTYQIKEETV
jgi:hypothetical protein